MFDDSFHVVKSALLYKECLIVHFVNNGRKSLLRTVGQRAPWTFVKISLCDLQQVSRQDKQGNFLQIEQTTQ